MPAPSSAQAASPEVDVSSALADFDAGREQGQDLEQLFDELERKLGVAPEAPEAEPGPPAFPGVVAALVGEFRWER